MKIDRLPIRLLVFATVLYLVAMAGFGLLAKGYRMSVPQATPITLTDLQGGEDARATLRATTELPADTDAFTFKYFHQGIPKYIHLANPVREQGAKAVYTVAITGDIPPVTSDSIAGFVHLLQPIEQPLLSFLLE